MSGPGGFLSRWSRRKQEAAKEIPADDAPARDDGPDASDGAAAREEQPSSGGELEKEKKIAAVSHGAAEKSEPAFDLAKLPSIDSIAADTDIRAFLMPGVPAALRQAALRRAWSADPKIRDFIEMAENQWDFNAPGVPGFDFSPPTGDLKRMLADIFGEVPAPGSPESKPQAMVVTSDATVTPQLEVDSHRNVNEPDAAREADGEVPSQESAPEIHPVRQTVIAEYKSDDVAPKKNDAVQEDDDRPPRRSHGGAMPR